MAFNQGSSEAAHSLGLMYMMGDGVEKVKFYLKERIETHTHTPNKHT